jgi:hypothetical protein
MDGLGFSLCTTVTLYGQKLINLVTLQAEPKRYTCFLWQLS